MPRRSTARSRPVQGATILGQRVLVYDTDGYFMGVSLAEKLALEVRQVTYVTSFPEVAPYMVYTLENHRQVRLLHHRTVGRRV
jgi:hypothetical protein